MHHQARAYRELREYMWRKNSSMAKLEDRHPPRFRPYLGFKRALSQVLVHSCCDIRVFSGLHIARHSA